MIFAEALRLLLVDVKSEQITLTHVERLADLPVGFEQDPDVVLLDLSLPDAEGIDSIRGVQNRLPGVPIVVLTADADEQQAVQMVRGGAQDYLVKGRFNVDTLVRAMRYAIERVQSEHLKRQLLQADRLAAVGRPAAGVTHEISNPATFVQASSRLIQGELARAQAVARAHGGDIRCDSELGHGTRFEVSFPGISHIEVRLPTPPPPPSPAAAGRARVLLVDDEPSIREVYSLLLADEFDVVTAADGHGALALLEEPASFDVIVSDVMMPDMDAAELLDAISKVSPKLAGRFILYTGGAVSERARRLVDGGQIPVLYKPLLTDELKAAIRLRLFDG